MVTIAFVGTPGRLCISGVNFEVCECMICGELVLDYVGLSLCMCERFKYANV